MRLAAWPGSRMAGRLGHVERDAAAAADDQRVVHVDRVDLAVERVRDLDLDAEAVEQLDERRVLALERRPVGRAPARRRPSRRQRRPPDEDPPQRRDHGRDAVAGAGAVAVVSCRRSSEVHGGGGAGRARCWPSERRSRRRRRARGCASPSTRLCQDSNRSPIEQAKRRPARFRGQADRRVHVARPALSVQVTLNARALAVPFAGDEAQAQIVTRAPRLTRRSCGALETVFA